MTAVAGGPLAGILAISWHSQQFFGVNCLDQPPPSIVVYQDSIEMHIVLQGSPSRKEDRQYYPMSI